MNKPPPCKGLNIQIPIIFPIKGFINHESGLPFCNPLGADIGGGNFAREVCRKFLLHRLWRRDTGF